MNVFVRTKMATRMTPEELTKHAQKCFLMSQYAIFIGNFYNKVEMAKAAKLWLKAGKRAEYRADCIWSGGEDPAFSKNSI